jgi:hypothetical protein
MTVCVCAPQTPHAHHPVLLPLAADTATVFATFQNHFVWRRFALETVADGISAMNNSRLPSVQEFAT